jgi:HK97 family phage prohead protease
MDTKNLRVEVKDAAKGEVSAVFSTFGVIDSDRDVTPAGAFEDGAQVLISAYGHQSWQGALPVGKGVIRTTKTEALLDGQFFMDTAAGRETFEVVKQLGELGQWSYGYDVLKESYGDQDGQRVRFLEGLKVHEVSPVLIGAGVNTRTLSAKSKQTFADEAQAVMAALQGLNGRAADVMAMRAEKGKEMSPESKALLEQVQAELKKLTDLLDIPVPPIPADDGAVQEYLRMVARNVA